MHIGNFTFTAVILVSLLAGITLILLQNEALRKKGVNYFYLLNGGLAIYCVEMTNYRQPFQHTILLVVALCLISITIDGILESSRKAGDMEPVD